MPRATKLLKLQAVNTGSVSASIGSATEAAPVTGTGVTVALPLMDRPPRTRIECSVTCALLPTVSAVAPLELTCAAQKLPGMLPFASIAIEPLPVSASVIRHTGRRSLAVACVPISVEAPTNSAENSRGG